MLVTATPPNQKSQTDTLLPIIEHYRTKAMDSKRRKVDLSALLLQSTKFKDTVHRNEVLFEAFYAPYLADNRQSPNSPNLNIFFGLPQFYKSGPVDGLQDPHFDLLRRRQCVKSYTALYEHLLPVNRQVRCSQNLHRHFTLIAAVGWVHSLQLSRKYLNSFIASQNSCDSSDSSKSDLVALYQNSLPPYNISIGLFGRPEIPNFISGVDLLSPEEIRTLVQITRTRKAKGADKLRLDIALKRLCNRILVHSHCPLLAEEEIFKVLMDTDKSTSHRHFFTISELIKELILALK